MLDEMGFGPLEEKETTTGAVLSRITTDLRILPCGFFVPLMYDLMVSPFAISTMVEGKGTIGESSISPSNWVICS